MQTNRLRTINIHYLNSIPYRALRECADLDYREGLPVESAAALLQKNADLALLPTASILKHGFYDILPYGVIADGPVESVFLLSQVPLEDLNEITVDVSSETSVILVKTILAEFYPKIYSRLVFNFANPAGVLNSVRGKVGGLIIGDDGLKSAGRFHCAIDLGSEWKKFTGAPFLFAAWAYRPNTLSAKQINSFNQAVEIGLKHRTLYARDWADTQGISREEAMRYVGEVISYPITPRVKEAAADFIGRAAKHNFLPKELINSVHSFSTSLNKSGSLLSNAGAIEEALKGRRLSIGSAQHLVEELPLAKLARLSAESRSHDGTISLPIFHLSLEDEKVTPANFGEKKLLSPNQIIDRLETIPEDSILVVESIGFSELTFDFFKDLLTLLNRTKRLNITLLSVSELQRISSETSLSFEDVVLELKSLGLKFISGVTQYLLSDQERANPLEYLKYQRIIAKCGLKTITNLRVSGEHSILEYAIHLYQLRQLQDQTDSIVGHFIDSCPTNSKLYSEFHTPGHYFKVICLARLILDNVPNISISPKVFGKPVAELLSALGPARTYEEQGILNIV